MSGTADMFRKQARTDLELAQLIPGHDLSGEALGESMFLAQQCMEKQLKAIVLGADEALGLGMGDGFLRDLSHKFYLNLHKTRKRFVKNLGLPPDPVLRAMGRDPGERAFGRNERIIGNLGAFWANYGRSDSEFTVAMWKQSMRVDLLEHELAALDDFNSIDAAELSEALGRPVAGDPKNVRIGGYSSPPPMRAMMGDSERLRRAYEDHKWRPNMQALRNRQDFHMAVQDRIFSDFALRHLGEMPVKEQRGAASRLVAEFAFEAASFQAYRYAPLFPHNELGRYPMRLPCGRSTTEVYEAQADVALHWVYNEARLNYEMLCEHASKLDELCGLGREHGYWKDAA